MMQTPVPTSQSPIP